MFAYSSTTTVTAGTVSALALTIALTSAGAQEINLEQIVVTPNRTPTEESKVGSTVNVVTKEQIERESRPVIIDYLNQIPGISLASQGGLGKETSLSIRGADKKYVKTLFNGIDISDTTATQVQTSYEHILADGITGIEVLKGSQSILYGSDAVAGVINISTLPDPDQIGLTQRMLIEGGSNETARGAYALTNVTDRSRFSMNLGGLYSGGISAALVNGNPLIDSNSSSLEDDFYQNVTGSFAGEFQLSDNFSVFGSGFIVKSKGDFDASGLPPTDNTLNTGRFDQHAGRVGFNLDLLDGRFRNTVAVQLAEIDREVASSSVFENDAGELERSDFEGRFQGRRSKLDYQGAFDISDRLMLQFGGDIEEQRAWITNNFGTNTDDRASIAGLWTQLVAEPADNLTLSAGVRHDEHSEFGGFTSYRGTAAYLFEQTGTKLRASIGTGFRAPSLYELNYVSFDPTIPLPDLDPEESLSWDIGIDQYFMGGNARASLTYFQLDTDNLIDYDFVNDTYIQFPGTTRRNGIEAEIAYAVNGWLEVGGSYTYTHTEQEDGERRPRIPEHMFGLSASAEPWERWTISASAKIALDTIDLVSPSFGTFDRVPLDDYVLVNAKIGYKPTENTELYLRAENILDQEYQTVYGYGTPGFSVFAGFRAKFGP